MISQNVNVVEALAHHVYRVACYCYIFCICKEELRLRKEESKEKFIQCKEVCICKTVVCQAIELQQCSICKNVQKSPCNKKACKVNGVMPIMIHVAARKSKLRNRRKGRGEQDKC